MINIREVNKKIQKSLDKICDEDPLIGNFLRELIKYENIRGKHWQYKSPYRKVIEEYAEEWSKHV